MGMFLLMIGLFFFLFIIVIALFAVVIYLVKKHVDFYPQYEEFAKANHYKYADAMGRRDVVIHDKWSSASHHVQLYVNPYIRQYGDFTFYPFGRGTDRWVMFLIEGRYKSTDFRAFTYHFKKCLSDSIGDRAGYFGIVMIPCENVRGELPANMFFEKNMLCQFTENYLDVNTIHGTIDRLLEITNNPGEACI